MGFKNENKDQITIYKGDATIELPSKSSTSFLKSLKEVDLNEIPPILSKSNTTLQSEFVSKGKIYFTLVNNNDEDKNWYIRGINYKAKIETNAHCYLNTLSISQSLIDKGNHSFQYKTIDEPIPLNQVIINKEKQNGLSLGQTITIYPNVPLTFELPYLIEEEKLKDLIFESLVLNFQKNCLSESISIFNEYGEITKPTSYLSYAVINHYIEVNYIDPFSDTQQSVYSYLTPEKFDTINFR